MHTYGDLTHIYNKIKNRQGRFQVHENAQKLPIMPLSTRGWCYPNIHTCSQYLMLSGSPKIPFILLFHSFYGLIPFPTENIRANLVSQSLS